MTLESTIRRMRGRIHDAERTLASINKPLDGASEEMKTLVESHRAPFNAREHAKIAEATQVIRDAERQKNWVGRDF